MAKDKTENSEPKRISPKEAVTHALEYYRSVTGDQGAIGLEEIELSDDLSKWLLTLSHREPNAVDNALYALYPNSEKKLYKSFVVDAFSGDVLSMKIKKL